MRRNLHFHILRLNNKYYLRALKRKDYFNNIFYTKNHWTLLIDITYDIQYNIEKSKQKGFYDKNYVSKTD